MSISDQEGEVDVPDMHETLDFEKAILKDQMKKLKSDIQDNKDMQMIQDFLKKQEDEENAYLAANQPPEPPPEDGTPARVGRPARVSRPASTLNKPADEL